MQIISKIGENGSSNHLEIGIMNNGKMSVSVSLWTPAGRYNKSVWLNKEEVVQLLDAIDDWVYRTESREACENHPKCQYCGEFASVAIVKGKHACGRCKDKFTVV